MTKLNGLKYETVLEMVTEFQWLREFSCLRIASKIKIDDPVMESLTKLTASVYKLHKANAEDIASLIPKAMFEVQDIIAVKQSGGVIKVGHQVTEFIGVGHELIGTVNLCTVAYGLVIRKTSPGLWNQFCYDVDKVEWLTDTKKQKSRVSRSTGPTIATSSNDVAQQWQEDTQDSRENDNDVIDPEDRSNDPEVRKRHAGLATAFDDHEFNDKAEKLLKGTVNEDLEADKTVITGDDSVPTRCSKHHQVIQEKYNAARYRRSGKKSM